MYRLTTLSFSLTSTPNFNATHLETSNISRPTFQSSNQSLSAWLPVPWSTNVGDGYEMVVIQYGRYATLPMRGEIQQDFSGIFQVLQDGSYYSSDGNSFMNFNTLIFVFGCLGNMDEGLCLHGMRKAIKAIEGSIFTYGDDPRELKATIRGPSQFEMRLALHWRYISD